MKWHVGALGGRARARGLCRDDGDICLGEEGQAKKAGAAAAEGMGREYYSFVVCCVSFVWMARRSHACIGRCRGALWFD